MLKISVTAVFILIWIGVSAQDFQSDFGLVSKEMASAESVQLEVKVRVYEKKEGRLLNTMDAQMNKMAENSLHTLGELTILRNGNFEVRVDTEEKVMLIMDIDKIKKENAEWANMDTKELEKLVRKFSSKESGKASVTPTLVSNDHGIRTYKFKTTGEFKEALVVFDMNKKTIRSISYEYSEAYGNRFVKLDYETFEYNTSQKETFETKNFFTSINNKYVPSNAYKGYKIVTEE